MRGLATRSRAAALCDIGFAFDWSLDIPMTTTAEIFTPSRGTLEQGRSWIGRRQCIDAAGALVTESMVKVFCAALDDGNRLYWNASHCPPALLFSLGMQPLQPGLADGARTLVLEVPLPGKFGIAVESSAEFYQPIHVGDRITVTEEAVAISDDKRTRLGVGNFLTVATEYVAQDQELRARHMMTSFRYKPWGNGEEGEQKKNEVRPVGAAGARELRPTSLPITYLSVIQGAAATFDWFPGHHDPEFARSQGVSNIYLNTMVCQGIIDRFVLDWAGAGAVLRKRSVRIRRPVIAGHTATVTGAIVSLGHKGVDETLDIDAAIDTPDGTCVSARVTVQRSRPPAARRTPLDEDGGKDDQDLMKQ